MNENSNIKYCSKRPPQKTAQIVMCALWVQCDVCYPRGLHACICFTCLPCWIHACFLSMCANTHGAFSSYVWYIYMTLGKKESFDGAKRTKNRCQPFKKLLFQGYFFWMSSTHIFQIVYKKICVLEIMFMNFILLWNILLIMSSQN